VKNLFRKNQVIITALAIMIAVAGYLNFAEEKGSQIEDAIALEEGGEEVADADDDTTLTISDTVLIDDEEEVAQATESDTDAGNAVLVSNTIGSDFFSAARLSREQTRAKNKEMLMEIVDNENVSEAQKEEAVNSIVELTEIAERETATESLLEAKGFSDVVVSIVDDSVDVIVNANELTEQEIAQIEDIVKRKTEVGAENIVISPVGVKN
jgi:stage III sporulation protein AH